MSSAVSLREPVFCFTCDTDWNHDNALVAIFDLFRKHGVKLTVFATHRSETYERYDNLQIGLHPNFLPGSTHGATVDEVLDHVFGLFPQAETYRSHSYYDSQQLSDRMAQRGIRYDANLSLYMQDRLEPLRHCHGALRFPSFFDDNIHLHHGGSWDFAAIKDRLLTPGLKIFNFHPYPVALNIPSFAGYAEKRHLFKSLSPEDIAKHRFPGPGPAEFLDRLLEYVACNRPSYHLRDLNAAFAPAERPAVAGEVAGRPRMAGNYAAATPDQRKELVRRQYESMDAQNIYITSRDFQLRELEIDAIRRHLQPGKVLDCGCGNGYTLLSLGRKVAGCDMLGVDFSENLLQGAAALREQYRTELKSVLRFECHDVLEFMERSAQGFDTIITERLVVNLPTREAQQRLIESAIRLLRPGGVYLMVEGTQQGFEQLNRYRVGMGLAAIPDSYSGNESSLKLDEPWLARIVQGTQVAQIEATENFSVYNLASKVLHPILVAPEEPKFSAAINRHAAELQRVSISCGDSLPDIGAGKLWLIRRTR